MIVDESTPAILMRENYYSVINGYKDPFLDKDAMRSSSEDVYKPGVSFDWVYGMFSFDRELRAITFRYLIQAEAALKTATVYAFCSNHPSPSAYLERSSFCGPNDMLLPKWYKGNKQSLYEKSMAKLMSVLNGKLDRDSQCRPFVKHYLDSYGSVPLWVLANDLTFGNMSHFFQLMKRGDQNEVCKNLYLSTGRDSRADRIFARDVLRAYRVLVDFRNLCAHDERLYCAKRATDTYATMLDHMGVALPEGLVAEMRAEIRALILQYKDVLHIVSESDLASMLGVKL